MNRQAFPWATSFTTMFGPDHLYEEIESKNSFGVIIGIFSNGLRTSRSGSPVMMRSAFPERASSKYLLSSGSRQRDTWWETMTDTVSARYRVNSILRSASLKYLSNLLLCTTSFNSSYISLELKILSDALAFSKASVRN